MVFYCENNTLLLTGVKQLCINKQQSNSETSKLLIISPLNMA